MILTTKEKLTMNNILSNLLNQFSTNKLQNTPVMNMFNQMMNGKTTEQQIQTLINSAQSRGIDINKKIFSKEDLKKMNLM